MPPKRYFDDERSAKPGVLSDELRAALNLHDDKLPPWIYKMRVLGYPPGWLQQADISSSSLQLFDDSSQARQAIDLQVKEQAFNPECFVEFPGFNAPVPEGVKDHCEVLGMPPMQVWQQLNYVKQTILPPKPVPYKRLKLSKNDSDKKNGSTVNIDDDDEIQIIEEPPKLEKKLETTKVPEREKEEGEATDSDDDIIAISSSTEEPKPQVQKDTSILNISTTIIEEIPRSQSPSDSVLIVSPCKSTSDNQTSTSSSSQPPSDSNQDQPKHKPESDQQEAEKLTDIEHQTEINAEDKRSTDDALPQSPTKTPSIKLIGMGCPLPADVDSKKPPLEKFAVGMGELIYFENLPTSTGVFDKMRGVIHKVRKKLSE